MTTQLGRDGKRVEVSDDQTEPTAAVPVADSQITADGRRQSMDDLGVDRDAELDHAGLSEGAVNPTLVPPVEGTQINTDGVREYVEGSAATDDDQAADDDDDDGPTKKELLDRAKELDIAGRSGMDKAELASAVEEAEAKDS